MKEKKIDFSKCKPKLHVLYPCWTVFDEKMLQSAVQRSSVRYPPIGRNGFTDALRSPMAHTNIYAHDQLPQPVRVYSVQHSTCIHMYSTCSVLYMYIVHCTVHVLYSRVVQLNDLAFRYKIVHSYTQTSAQSVESMNIRCKPKLVTVQSPQRKNKKARVPVSIIVVFTSELSFVTRSW